MKHRALKTILAAAVVVAGAGSAFAASAGGSGPSNYNAAASTRILDTRTAHTPLAAHGTLVLTVTGAPANATAVVLNLTETNATGGGYLLAYADGSARPAAGSNLNFGTGQTQANQATVPVSDGKVDIYSGAGSGSTDVIADLEGWYTPTPAATVYTPPTTVSQSAALNASSVVGTANSGGGAVAGATDELDVALTAGTYQVSVNAKATPNASTASNVDPQFFVYDQTLTSSFTGDQFNAGSGALQNGTSHDSYFSGSGLVTVPAAGETLHVYAFGYDGDSGASTYTLDSLTLTAVPVS